MHPPTLVLDAFTSASAIGDSAAAGAHAYGALLTAAAPRTLASAGLALAVGAGVWRLWVAARGDAAARPAPATLARVRASVARAGTVGAVAGLLAAAWGLVVQVGSLGDADGGRSMLGALVWHTEWGHRWVAQLACLTVAATAFSVARRGETRPARPQADAAGRPRVPGRGVWAVGAAGAVGATALEGVMGHAGADAAAPVLALVLGAGHVLAATIWLGTLAILAWVWRVTGALRTKADRRPDGGRPTAEPDLAFVASQLAAFAPVALGAAVVTAAAGVGNAWLRLAGAGSGALARFGALAGTSYGRLLVAKLSVVLVVATAGAVNARRSAAHRAAAAGPAAGTSTLGLPALDHGARVELAAALVVFALSAVLAVSSPPGAE